jgi:hypothetical protein
MQQFGAEDLGQGLVREKIGAFAFRAFGSPKLSLVINGSGVPMPVMLGIVRRRAGRR